MDAEKKKALIAKLSVAKNFDENLAKKSRIWFVDKVIRVFEGVPGATDTQVTQKTTDLVTLAKTRVTAERDFVMNLKADGNKRFNASAIKLTRRHRVQILYGAIAHEPQLAESGQRDYLLFVARRRFRCFCRTYFWVNPNGQGYFRYPGRCQGGQVRRVNEDAASFWEREDAEKDLPIKMKAAAEANPVTAVLKLWVSKTDDACKGNLFDCEAAADITFIDSLLEAKTPDDFLKAMPADYLKIKNMDESAFAKQPPDVVKNPLKRVAVPMVKVPVPMTDAEGALLPAPRDLQVGDQCYIYNHPLYKTFRPTGDWTGEFSFVFSSGDRNHRSKKGFVFGGHGKQGTLYQFYNDFTKDLAACLSVARRLATVHLAFMAAASSTATEVEDDVQIHDPITETYSAAARHRLIAYDATVLARDFTKVPTRTKRRRKGEQPGFLVVQSKVAHAFYLVLVDNPDENKPLTKNLKKTIDDIPLPTRRVRYPIKIGRVEAPDPGATPAQIYAIENWGVAFAVPRHAEDPESSEDESSADEPVLVIDRAKYTEEFWPFFEEMGGGKWKRNELTTDKRQLRPELFDAPFCPFHTETTDIEVYLPRIDFGAHRTFLLNNGAI